MRDGEKERERGGERERYREREREREGERDWQPLKRDQESRGVVATALLATAFSISREKLERGPDSRDQASRPISTSE